MKIAILVFCSGCGAGVGQLADPMYEIARMTCGNAEELVVSRDLDPEIKAARIAEIRAKCDPVFAAFERLAE